MDIKIKNDDNPWNMASACAFISKQRGKPTCALTPELKKVFLEDPELSELLVKSKSTGKLYFTDEHMKWDENKFIMQKMCKISFPQPYCHDLGKYIIVVLIDENGGSLSD